MDIIKISLRFLKRSFAAVRAKGGLAIADEVQTGFGRLGSHFWGFECKFLLLIAQQIFSPGRSCRYRDYGQGNWQWIPNGSRCDD